MARAIAGVAAALSLASGLAGCGSVSTLAAGRQIATTPHCTEFAFSIYFAGGSAELTKQAQTVIRDAGAHTKGCTVASVEVVGLSDYLGVPEANLALSRRRADRVAAALAQSGFLARSSNLAPWARRAPWPTMAGPSPCAAA